MQTYKVTFTDNKPVHAEAAIISQYRDTRKVRTTESGIEIEWLIVCCEEHLSPMALAGKLANILIRTNGR